MAMRIVAASLVAACVVATGGIPTVAHAKGVSIVSGGPPGNAKSAAAKALTEMRSGVLAVCWKRAGQVRVELTIAASGEVSRARHTSGGATGQCVAGVLAVQTLPASKRGYRIVVDIDAAGTGGRTASTITEDLVGVRPSLQRCFDRAKGARAGQVAIRFLIKPDGRLVDPAIASSDIASKEAESCMLSALRSFRMREAAGARTLSYTLTMGFKPGGGGSAAVAGGGDQPVPKKDGPISAAVLGEVMNKARPRFAACAGKARGKLDGVAVVRFTIGADGTTRNVKIKSSTLKQPAVEACLVGHASKLRFPAEKGRAKTRVFYPFQFKP